MSVAEKGSIKNYAQGLRISQVSRELVPIGGLSRVAFNLSLRFVTFEITANDYTTYLRRGKGQGSSAE